MFIVADLVSLSGVIILCRISAYSGIKNENEESNGEQVNESIKCVRIEKISSLGITVWCQRLILCIDFK